MQGLGSCLRFHNGQWVLDVRPAIHDKTTKNDLQKIAAVAKELASWDLVAVIKIVGRDELHQSSRYWLEKIHNDIREAMMPGNNHRQLLFVDRVQSIHFDGPFSKDAEAKILECVRRLGGTLPAQNRAILNPPPKTKGPDMKPLTIQDNGERHIFDYYVFNIDGDELIASGSLIVPGADRDEAENRYLPEALQKIDKVKNAATKNTFFKVRYVMSFTKPKQVDPKRQFIDLLKEALKEDEK